MLSKQLAFGLALAAGLALTSTAKAGDDVIRLALPSSSSDVLTLGVTPSDLDADTIDVVRRGYYGGYYGGYRGGYGYGGYRGGYYGGYRGYGYGGYRGGYYGGYRGYGYGYGYGGYRGGYYGGYRGYGYGYGYYRPRYYGGYYSSSYYSSGYYGISDDQGADVYAICARSVVRSAPSTYYRQPSYSQPSYQPQPIEELPAPSAVPQVMPRADESTFPYDGGPKNPVPMPVPSQSLDEAKPTQIPYGRLQPGETLVSVKPKQTEEKKTSGKWNFPAYGEKPTRGK